MTHNRNDWRSFFERFLRVVNLDVFEFGDVFLGFVFDDEFKFLGKKLDQIAIDRLRRAHHETHHNERANEVADADFHRVRYLSDGHSRCVIQNIVAANIDVRLAAAKFFRSLLDILQANVNTGFFLVFGIFIVIHSSKFDFRFLAFSRHILFFGRTRFGRLAFFSRGRFWFFLLGFLGVCRLFRFRLAGGFGLGLRFIFLFGFFPRFFFLRGGLFFLLLSGFFLCRDHFTRFRPDVDFIHLA